MIGNEPSPFQRETAMKTLALILLAFAFIAGVPTMTYAKEPDPKDDVGYIEVEMAGIIRTGVMAIGGESTGTTITALGFTWELDLGGNEDFAKFAQKSHGMEVVVKGTVTVKQGVERGRRVIVVVKKLLPLTK